MNTYIIAEAGVNHNGSREMAFQLVDAAAEAGVDAIKFQTFKAENLVTRYAAKASYQKDLNQADESQYSMLKHLELSHEIHHELAGYCEQKGIAFLSTAFDLDSLSFLVNDLGLKTLKIPSGEITNGPLLLQHAKTGCELILSTGMATLDEIEKALGVISFGLMHGNNRQTIPSTAAFKQAYSSEPGQKLIKEMVTLLHCTTEYPAPENEINLNAMTTMREIFGTRVGYSDHSEGIVVPIAATAVGACLVEKHFTLDKTLPGPDHKASLEPDELQEMVRAIRVVERAMGDGVKEPMPSELKNRPIVRKSLVASKSITSGELFSVDNISIKRPGTGLNPMEYWNMMGKTSVRDYKPDELID